MTEIITVQNVRGRYNDNGYAEINLEDAARGLGFVETKGGKEYVKWRRVTAYLSEFGLSQQVAKAENTDKNGLPEFIPENVFYKLCFKASNAAARRFQDIVTDAVLPSIRRHGIYATPGAAADLLSNPRKPVRGEIGVGIISTTSYRSVKLMKGSELGGVRCLKN